MFKSYLRESHSKATTERIIGEVLDAPDRFRELVRIMKEEKEPLPRRAAWPLSYIAEKNPSTVEPYLKDLVELLVDRKQHSAVRRNIVRALRFVDIPEDLEGLVLDNCFRFLNSSDEPVAVKIWSMMVIYNFSRKYPEIRNELKSSIESQWEYGSKGFRNRGGKILRELDQGG